MNKSVIVTGGAGFIGSHLVEKLSKSYKVVVVDIKIHPKSYFATEKLIKKTVYEKTNINNKKKLEKIFLKYKPDYIFHLAAEPIVEQIFRNPYPAFKTNVMGTVNVLECAQKVKNLKGVIVASSDKAYGKTKTAYDENSPLRGDHPYDVSKSAADLISYSYFKSYGLPVSITRFGNVYGEGDFHFGRIIPGICKSIIAKKKLELRSDGTFVRDYLYVKDVVDGYIFLMKNFQKAKGEAFNFSSSDTLSVLSLIKKSEKILDAKIQYKILNIAKNEIPYQHLNDSKIRKLGWKNNYSLKEALPRTLDWYRTIL